MDYLDKISTIENLMMAWRKLEKAFEYGDVWFDPLFMAGYKMNLLYNLTQLSKKLKAGTYSMHHISPVPFPKGKSTDGSLRLRQSFYVNIEDQLVWVAVCNIIGWIFDRQMPAWSYGNRLYLYMWKQDGQWKFGNYRNSHRLLYKKWSQSWPAMRKRITASLQKMAGLGQEDMYDEQQDMITLEASIPDEMSQIKLKYLMPDYFPHANTPVDTLYWAGLDLEKFYQKIDIRRVKDILIQGLDNPDEGMANLLDIITTFKVDYSEYPANNKDLNEALKDMQLEERPEIYEYLPTGLIVAGFLSNVFMLSIDKKIDSKLDTDKTIIHFRYVDDHVFISSNPKSLYNWLKEYKLLVEENGLSVNLQKIEPVQIFDSCDSDNILRQDANSAQIMENIKEYACIDPRYPTPLMTQTLNKVSQLSGLDLNLLNSKEFDLIFSDLLTLLVTDIPEQEIKKSTRISFACTMFSRLLVNGDIDYKELYRLRRKWYDKIKCNNKGDTEKDKVQFEALCNDCCLIDCGNLQECVDLDTETVNRINDIIKSGERKQYNRNRQVFDMLIYALKQVPDKIRVWIRTLMFCSKHYPKGIKEIYELLAKLVDTSEISKSSAEYIYAVLNLVRADNIVTATARLAMADFYTRQEQTACRKLLENMWNVPIVDCCHSFVADSQFILNKAASFYNEYATDFGMPKLECDTQFMKDETYHDINLDKTFWLRWVNYIIADKNPKESSVANSLFAKYKQYIRNDSKFYDASFLSDDNHVNLEEIKYEGCYSLAQWIELVRQKVCDRNLLHVFNSELLAVNIMLAICEEFESNINKYSDLLWLTPNNIFLEDNIMQMSWNKLLNTPGIAVRFGDDKEILSDYYIQTFNMDNSQSIHAALPYGLGIIFLQLLTKRSSLPWVFNRPLYGFEWQSAINELMQSGQISSYNYRIVCSCLSARSRETRFLKGYLNEQFVEDTYRDSPIIKTWADLRTELSKSRDLLRQNLISVADGEHRQLTVIDLN